MKIFLTVTLFLYSLTDFAQVATYTFTNSDPGTEVSKSVTSNDPNLTAADITRGVGITANSGAGSINSRGWDSPAQDVTDYYEFTLTPGANHELNLTAINLTLRKSAAGPTNYVIAYSIGGGADIVATSGPISVTTDITVNASFSIKTPLAVRFRIYAWGASNTTGTLRLDNTLTVNGSAPLPVKLVAFTGQSITNAILLNWATSWEEKNEGFDILKGITATNFEKVGFVEGHTTTKETSTYSFTDSDVQGGQLYYYQLKQRDIGGGSELSKIIAVRVRTSGEDMEPLVYPNPNRGNFMLSAKNLNTTNISLYNSSGVEIPVIISKNQSSAVLSIDAKVPIPTGMYHLQLQASDGTYKQSLKVIIQ